MLQQLDIQQWHICLQTRIEQGSVLIRSECQIFTAQYDELYTLLFHSTLHNLLVALLSFICPVWYTEQYFPTHTLNTA